MKIEMFTIIEKIKRKKNFILGGGQRGRNIKIFTHTLYATATSNSI
jgi:hypothetical protein